MSDFWAEARKIKKTKKPHNCVYCGDLIEVGESATYNFGLWEGFLQSNYFCKTCDILYNELNLDFSDGIIDFEEDLATWLNGIECPTCKESEYYFDFDRKTHIVECHCEFCDTKWIEDLFEILGISDGGNSTGNMWTEEFESVSKAVKWLCGESEEKQ